MLKCHVAWSKNLLFCLLISALESEPIEVEMRITEVNGEPADYTDDLADPESEAFKEMEEDVCAPVCTQWCRGGGG